MGVRAATAALQGLATNDINQALVGAASPYLNQEIKKRTTNADGTVNTQANLIAHALLGAAEAKVTGNHALAGATAAVTAEAAAPYIMQALYQTDNPAELNETQKRNVANLSQIAAGLSGGLIGDSTQNAVTGAEIGKRAVENNLLRKDKDEYVYERSIEFEKTGDVKNKSKTKEYLVEDAYIDYLLVQYQKDPNNLNAWQKEFLHSKLIEISNSYRIPVERLYKWDFNNVIKRDDSKLSRYLGMDEYFWNNSYEGKQAKSFAVGVVATPLIYGTNAAMNSAIWSRLTAFSKAYPKTTEAVVSGTVSTGFDIYNGDVSYEKTLANYALGGIKAGKSTSQQLSIDTIYMGMTLVNAPSKSDEDIKAEGGSKVFGTAASLASDYYFNGRANSLQKQFIGNVVSGYAESKSLEILKREGKK